VEEGWERSGEDGMMEKGVAKMVGKDEVMMVSADCRMCRACCKQAQMQGDPFGFPAVLAVRRVGRKLRLSP
jgi:hypothetical protein